MSRRSLLLLVVCGVLPVFAVSASEHRCFDDGVVQHKFGVAFDQCKRLADQGSVEAEDAMGGFFYGGLNVNKDFNQAFNYYSKAAAAGYRESEYMLGIMYENGEGVTADQKASVEWTEKSALHGFPAAQYGMARKYGIGKKRGVEQDFVRAYAWLLLAKQGGAANDPHLDVEKVGNLLENQLGAEGKKQAQELADQLLKRINPNTQPE